jgi:hypothetical protein
MSDKIRTISKEDLLKKINGLPNGSEVCITQDNVHNEHAFAEFYDEPVLQNPIPKDGEKEIYAIAFSCDWN